MEEKDQQIEQTQELQSEAEKPHGTDWKAEARKWEKYAKENLAKAEEYKAKAARLDEIEEASKSELQKTQEAYDKASKELSDLKAAREHDELVSKVSQATGIPASLLHGSTEDELTESANAVSVFVESKKPSYPTDKGGGTTSKGMSKEDIWKIKDPAARRKAIEENVDQFK